MTRLFILPLVVLGVALAGCGGDSTLERRMDIQREFNECVKHATVAEYNACVDTSNRQFEETE